MQAVIERDVVTVEPTTVTACKGCGESLMPDAPCMNVGACSTADTAASAQSLRRGKAASAPAAWTFGGNVD